MSNYKFIYFLCITLLISSCAFNSTFHRSQKIPISIKEITHFNFEKDTTYISYNEENDEISLYKSESKLINKEYIIKNKFFESSSGNKLNGWLLTPKKQKPIATILHFHGSAVNLLFHYESIAPLVKQGFQVFTFDYSGYGFSEGKSTRKNALLDAYSALSYIKKTDFLKDTKLIIYGQSYGGYLASIVGSNNQDEIDGIVIEGAFSSHKEEAKHKSPFFGNLVKNEQTAEKEIRKNHKPILIIHSMEDKMVPFKFGEKIFQSANKPKEFYAIDKAHLLGLQYYSQKISKKIKEMIKGK